MGELLGGCGCEGCPLKGKINGRNAGDFDGGCRVRRCPLNGKNAGADKQRGNEWKKLQKLSFLRFEMVRKSAISRQTK